MSNIIIIKKILISKKYNCYIIYYAYGIIKVKYLESLLFNFFNLNLFNYFIFPFIFFLIMITIIKCILSY